MYVFVAWSISKYALGRHLSDVNVVASDQFLLLEAVKSLGFVKVVYFSDSKYSLKEENTKKVWWSCIQCD